MPIECNSLLLCSATQELTFVTNLKICKMIKCGEFQKKHEIVIQSGFWLDGLIIDVYCG